MDDQDQVPQLEVVILSDEVSTISSFYCPAEKLEMVMKIAENHLADLIKTGQYTNPRIIVRTPIADV